MSSVLATVEVDIKLEQICLFSLVKEILDRKARGEIGKMSKRSLLALFEDIGLEVKEENCKIIIDTKNLEN